ncbi:hypothetical protein [Streptomyces sp. NPDC047841]|uniref:hypothetical protein n=1 Tax=Streptomyces sp. NPDC047841 TaxID=3154708 RepID=UPI003453739C
MSRRVESARSAVTLPSGQTFATPPVVSADQDAKARVWFSATAAPLMLSGARTVVVPAGFAWVRALAASSVRRMPSGSLSVERTEQKWVQVIYRASNLLSFKNPGA